MALRSEQMSSQIWQVVRSPQDDQLRSAYSQHLTHVFTRKFPKHFVEASANRLMCLPWNRKQNRVLLLSEASSVGKPVVPVHLHSLLPLAGLERDGEQGFDAKCFLLDNAGAHSTIPADRVPIVVNNRCAVPDVESLRLTVMFNAKVIRVEGRTKSCLTLLILQTGDSCHVD